MVIMNLFYQIKAAVKKMFSKNELRDKIGADIAVSQTMLDAITLWSECYENRAEWLTGKYRGKHLPAAISREFARLVTLEFKSELTGGKRAEFLSEMYKKVISDAPVFTEYACAKGGLMLKPYLSCGRIAAAYVQADSFFPTAYDSSGNITGCIFAERKIVGNKFFTRLENHDFTPGKYTVTNRVYLSDNGEQLGRSVPIGSVPEWAELLPKADLTGFKRPLFAYFKMPGANHIDSGSPLGVSVFAAALDAIKDADEQYARLLWEFEGSELAVHADITALEHKNGKISAPVHGRRLYRGLDIDGLYEVYSPQIRDQSLINGLNAILRDVEFLSGFAFGTFSNVEDTPKTATEIKISRQRSYCTVNAIQRSLKKCLEEFLICLNDLCDFYRLAPADNIIQSFEFDDSLVVDAEYEQKLLLQEAAAGLISPEEYRMRRYGETSEQAEKMLRGTGNVGG